MADPLVWTPSAVHAELMRILGVLDTVNNEVSAASQTGKITSDEWNQWYAAYLAGHNFITNASDLWGSNVTTARQHEQIAGKWHDLVKSRGGQTQGPANLIRPPDGSSPFSVSFTTIALVVGGGALAFYLMSLMRRISGGAAAVGLRGSTGVDLENLWGDENEPKLRRAFSWLTRTGAGRRFPGTPIGWYQQHQIAAIDALIAQARSKGFSSPWRFRVKAGEFAVKSGKRWIRLGLNARQLFNIADRKARGA